MDTVTLETEIDALEPIPPFTGGDPPPTSVESKDSALTDDSVKALADRISQPLTAIHQYAAGCLRRQNADAGQMRGVLEKICDQSTRAGESVHALRKLARGHC